MFYSNIPITHGVAVLVVVIILCRVITGLTSRSKVVELLLEGEPKCLLAEGVMDYAMYKKVGLPYDKFYAELRLKGVDHLGQLRKVYLETSGEMSIYFFPDATVKPGLEIYPEMLKAPLRRIITSDHYACTFCGNVQRLEPGIQNCFSCKNNSWTPPSIALRIT
jgi:uncharacterized membrane protein YcaP (DUF421 family)